MGPVREDGDLAEIIRAAHRIAQEMTITVLLDQASRLAPLDILKEAYRLAQPKTCARLLEAG